ncbi:GntR family transcriptional regulator [Oceanispirochaeta crateris]|uniref:GntR family transcriptional regulator n=1 Tax=Oceanispirochaeta crateris TaxID=2518645 RepID=A0A5C1QQY3_9SPIO|nr:GntR family transcriptional regulator [Oceanispirochaeta crateris]QEN09649.1 GntR family transcriptional regulator [Oceanispirochaeta crateris]
MQKIISLSIREQIYNGVKEQILKNVYKPYTLLQIDHLAENFGVSATPVREALVRLESDGLVTLIPNRGAQVTGICDNDIENIWEMRRLLEPFAAHLSLRLITDKELDDLESKIKNLKVNPFDHDLYIETDKCLHSLFFSHLSNDLLIEAIKKVHEMSDRLRYFAEESGVEMHDKIIEDVIHEHLTILAMIRTRDPERISAPLYTHLMNGERRALEARAKSSKTHSEN